MKIIVAVYLLVLVNVSMAGEVAIEMVNFTQATSGWKVDVTLRHADSGWDHYANEWRIVDEGGRLLGRRVLAHPHVEEQPFTRGLYRAKIPNGLDVVYVEAKDSVHGWSSVRVRVDLKKSSGDRYRVKRQ